MQKPNRWRLDSRFYWSFKMSDLRIQKIFWIWSVLHHLFDKAWPSSHDQILPHYMCLLDYASWSLFFSKWSRLTQKGRRGSDSFVHCSAHTDEFIHVIIVQNYKTLVVIDMTKFVGFIHSSLLEDVSHFCYVLFLRDIMQSLVFELSTKRQMMFQLTYQPTWAYCLARCGGRK